AGADAVLAITLLAEHGHGDIFEDVAIVGGEGGGVRGFHLEEGAVAIGLGKSELLRLLLHAGGNSRRSGADGTGVLQRAPTIEAGEEDEHHGRSTGGEAGVARGLAAAHGFTLLSTPWSYQRAQRGGVRDVRSEWPVASERWPGGAGKELDSAFRRLEGGVPPPPLIAQTHENKGDG